MATKKAEAGKEEKIVMPTILAFEKKLVTSDGFMFGTNWDTRHEVAAPLALVEKSVRGTFSNRMKLTAKDDPMKLNRKIESANPQRVDACALGLNQDTLKLVFTLKVLRGVEIPSACNVDAFQASYAAAAKKYIDKHGFVELGRRYAMNIANARFLWRNRVGAEKIEVVVRALGKKWTFDAYDFSLRKFDVNAEQVDELANLIAQALRGDIPNFFMSVEAYALIGAAQEVYPSEEMIFDKGKRDKSKVLYAAGDVAAFHSQKIGNAIRTIDTWYTKEVDEEIGIEPIAVEVYGSVTNRGIAHRQPKENDFYTFFDTFATGQALDDEEQEHYVMAMLVRGGVFGQSAKEAQQP